MPITDTTMDDQQSFNLIRQGGKMREQGYALLYRKYAVYLSRKVCRQSDNKLNEADAEEIVQETFINVVRHCESYKGDSTIKTWIISIAINCMNDHFRRSKARIPADKSKNDEENDHDDETEDNRLSDTAQNDETFEDCVKRGLVDCVDRAYAEFKINYPERALVLSLWSEGYDTSEIAAAIHRNLGATREYLSQCKKKSEAFLQHCREYISAA